MLAPVEKSVPLLSSLTLTLGSVDRDSPGQNAPITDWLLTIFPWTSAGRYPHSFDPSSPYWTQIPFILLEGTTHILGLDTLDIPGNVLENLYYLSFCSTLDGPFIPFVLLDLGISRKSGGRNSFTFFAFIYSWTLLIALWPTGSQGLRSICRRSYVC